MAGTVTNRQFWAIQRHYRKAVEKHPLFAASFMGDVPEGGDEQERFRQFWRQFAKSKKAVAERECRADYVLDAELAEVFEAFARGDVEQARNEIFDAIAVLLRMEANLSGFYEQVFGERPLVAEESALRAKLAEVRQYLPAMLQKEVDVMLGEKVDAE